MVVSELLRKVAKLQPKYSSKNTPEMEERGRLIRKELPSAFRESLPGFQAAMHPYEEELEIEGRDGIGRKTPAPWVRFYSNRLSPSATQGFYVVIHFSTDGTKCFFTLGTGVTKFDSESGDLKNIDDDEVKNRTGWVVSTLEDSGAQIDEYRDEISIGSPLKLPKRFELGTALCRTFDTERLDDLEVFEALKELLGFLSLIYVSVDRMDHLPFSEAVMVQAEGHVSANREERNKSQGRGLTATQRKAVEIRAMEMVREALENEDYTVIDTSANKPYDFLAERGSEEVKVEVKGTTSKFCDAVQMTRNEVRLHREENGATALGIVSGIVLQESNGSFTGTGGSLELIVPWDISNWTCEPVTYLVKKRS